MKRKTAAASPKQAPMMAHSLGAARKAASARGGMGLVLSVPVSLGTSAFVSLGRNVHAGGSDSNRGRRLFAPLVDEEDDDGGADQKIKDGHEPCNQAKAGFRWLGVDRGAEFLHEGLRDFVFGVASVHHGAEFLQHGRGHGAADMIALGEDLVAAAHTLKLAANLFGAVGLLLGEQRQNGERNDQEQRSDAAAISHGPHAELPKDSEPGRSVKQPFAARALRRAPRGD